VVGVYKAVAGKLAGQTSGVFRAVLVGVSLTKLTKESQVGGHARLLAGLSCWEMNGCVLLKRFLGWLISVTLQQ
jgi:hypothetical protein